MSENQYAATMDMEEAPYIPTHGEFKLDSGYSARMYTPVKIGTQDLDEESKKFWVLPYSDYDGKASVIGLTTENRFKTGYIDYDMYSIADGIGGYAPDIKLALHGGPFPLLNFGVSGSVINSRAAPHPSGYQEWTSGMAVIGKVMEHGAPTGEQCFIFIDIMSADEAVGV